MHLRLRARHERRVVFLSVRHHGAEWELTAVVDRMDARVIDHGCKPKPDLLRLVARDLVAAVAIGEVKTVQPGRRRREPLDRDPDRLEAGQSRNHRPDLGLSAGREHICDLGLYHVEAGVCEVKRTEHQNRCLRLLRQTAALHLR
ncbi:MAG: hypothetical protein H0U67_01075 [Gemmatimonadetes bacterium]|nr:hypothetical protein [Gemmatimonadota bacterium]